MPLAVYAACANDAWRKPRVAAWDLLAASAAGPVDPVASMFVGDAAGRPADHSDADYHFALNVGVAFRTPEAYFLDDGGGEPPGHKFNPAAWLGGTSWTGGFAPLRARERDFGPPLTRGVMQS